MIQKRLSRNCESLFCGAKGNRTSDYWVGGAEAGLATSFPDSQSVKHFLFWIISDGCVPSSCRFIPLFYLGAYQSGAHYAHGTIARAIVGGTPLCF